MKPIPISCIPILALAVFQCGAAEQQMSLPEQASGTADSDADAAATASRVTQALQNSKDAAAGKVAVSTHGNTIILSGKAGSEAEAQRIIAIATAAAAGMRITSKLEFEPGQKTAAEQKSAQLVRDVEAALRSDSATATLRVLVSMDDQQRILLFGPVPSREDRAAAQRVATRVPGVKRIDNRLIVPGD